MQKVSVIIPTKNRRKLLERALNSVYSQTYTNLEIIVIDEQSTDNTSDYLFSESQKGKITCIRNENPQGAGNARNMGIQTSTGDYIAFLDDDDEWLSTKIAEQIQLFTNPRVGLVYTGIELIYEDLGFSYKSIPSLKGDVFKQQLIENRIGVTSSVMLRASIAKELMFDTSLPARQDYEFWLRISKSWEVDGIQRPLAKIFARNNLKRITSDVSNYENAISYINEKYSNEISNLPEKKKTQRQADQFFFLASQSIKANNIVLAQRYFLKSLRTKFQIKSFLSYVASLLGIKAVLNIRRLKS